MPFIRNDNIDPAKMRDARNSPYAKLARAFLENRGTNLTAEDVDILLSDDAIATAIMNRVGKADCCWEGR